MFSGTTIVQAQDVIVKRDGSTILSKVLEVNQNDIKYKKFSNQQGPTYTIDKAEVMSINYESGDKDTFDNVKPTQTTTNYQAQTTPFGMNPNFEKDNLELVREFNSKGLVYTDQKTNKKAHEGVCILGLKEGSIIETPELKTSFVMKKWYGKVTRHRVIEERTLNLDEECPYLIGSYNHQYKIVIILKNKTDKTIYIDLANSYIIQNEKAKPYYVPTATSTTHGGSSGGSVNVGAVAGALGVGGALGTLASGVNVGGSSIDVNTKTTYSQRIVSIPPLASLELEPMEIGQGGTYKFEWQADILKSYNSYFKGRGDFAENKYTGTYYYQKGLKRGEVIDIPPMNNINPLGAFVTYSFSESMDATQSMRMDFYLRQLMGVNSKYIDFSQCPLIFF